MKNGKSVLNHGLVGVSVDVPMTVAVNRPQSAKIPGQRGGARNRHDRTSHALTELQCRQLIEAASAASDRGQPFNRFVTVSWERNGADGRDSVRLTGAFIRLAREWMLARGNRLAWAWVQEWSPRFGAHAHILMHVPDELAPLFSDYPQRWVKKLVVGCYVAGTVKTKQVRHDTRPTAFAPTYRHALLRTVSYMLKAAPATLEGPLGMLPYRSKPWGRHCMTFGKRIGIWQGWSSAGALPAQTIGGRKVGQGGQVCR